MKACRFFSHWRRHSRHPSCSGRIHLVLPVVAVQRRGVSCTSGVIAKGLSAASSSQTVSALPTTVDPAQLKKVLKANAVAHVAGHACFIMDCVFCKNKKAARKAESEKLYVNMVTGDYSCLQCGARGSWQQFEDYLSLPRTRRGRPPAAAGGPTPPTAAAGGESTATETPAAVALLWDTAIPAADAPRELLEKTLASLDLPTVSVDTLRLLEVCVCPESGWLLTPLRSVDGQLAGVRSLLPDGRERVVPAASSSGSCSGALLAGWSTVRGRNHVTLVSRMLDAIALHHGCRAPVLTLPHGTSSLSPELLPWLERFDRVRLWFPGDAVSWTSLGVFAKKLSEKRCTAVRPSADLGSPADALRAGASSARLLEAGSPVSHESVTTFSSLRENVRSELVNARQVAGVQWVRMAPLNKLLRGHRRGELTIFSGPTGSGKTTFISEYSLDLCMQGVNTLWGSFEINNTRLAKVMLTQFAGHSLEKRMKVFDQVADEFQKLPMWFMTFHGQNEIISVLDAMSHAAYMHDIGHVVLDNLQFMMGAGGVDRFLEQDNVVSKFRRFATMRNCHVTLVIHPRKERDEDELGMSSVFGGARATQEADNVIILQVLRTEETQRKYLQVLKNRFSGDLGPLPLRFNKDCLSFSCGRPASRGVEDQRPSVPADDDQL